MVLFLFIDGLGAGEADATFNPLARVPGLLSRFRDGGGPRLPAGAVCQLLDATLGVEGRPQSATGQSTLLTGVNAPALLGKHLTGFPNLRLRTLLEADNLFHRVQALGRRAAFLNAYHHAYLAAAGLPHQPPERVYDPLVPLPSRLARPAATTTAARAAGIRLRTFDDVLAGDALYHDFTHRLPLSRGLTGIEVLSPEIAGARLAAAAAPYHLAVYEYFLTDKAGHAADLEASVPLVDELQRFVGACVDALDLQRDTLVITSDHGNLEDLRTRNHTRNPVPLLALGRGARQASLPRDLTGVTPLLTDLASA